MKGFGLDYPVGDSVLGSALLFEIPAKDALQ
jgi:hypothetical protein